MKLRFAFAACLALAFAAPAAAEPLALRYEVSAVGIPILRLDFQLDETGGAYRIVGVVRTTGVADVFTRYVMDTHSEGALAEGPLKPTAHATVSRWRGKKKAQSVAYAADGTILAKAEPPEDPARPKPTAAQIAGTIDPLSALLELSRIVERTGRCGGHLAIFDGRRRYDLALIDEGAAKGAGGARRCSAELTKIAGFSWEEDYRPRTEHGSVVFGSPRPGAPPVPLAVDFGSNWGWISLKLVR